jgi:N6-adenosine-specific RNA methylase IME4
MAKKQAAQPTLWTFEDGEATIRPDGLSVSGNLNVNEWATLGKRLGKLRSGTQWSVGDWLLYGETKQFDEGAYEAAAEATGLKRGTLMNLKSVAKAFPKIQRTYEVPWSHYALVAGFDDEQRGELLARAQRHNLGWDDLRAICRTQRQEKAREWQTWPAGTYGVLYAAPPWRAAPWNEGQAGSMNDDELVGLAPAVQSISAPNSVLYLTATPFRLDEALRVMNAWGFHYRTQHVVMHDQLGNGQWNRERHHLILVGIHGDPVPPTDDHLFDSILSEGTEFFDRLEVAFNDAVPKVQLFARDTRPGWTSWGERLESMRDILPARAIRVRHDEVEVAG